MQLDPANTGRREYVFQMSLCLSEEVQGPLTQYTWMGFKTALPFRHISVMLHLENVKLCTWQLLGQVSAGSPFLFLGASSCRQVHPRCLCGGSSRPGDVTGVSGQPWEKADS